MKRALGLLLGALVLAGIAWLVIRGEGNGAPALPTRPDATAAESGPQTIAEIAGPRRESAPAQAPESAAPARTLPVSGVVLDELGQPITDAVVFIGAEENPFDDGQGAKFSQWDEHKGLTFPTSASGEFFALLPRQQPVYVCAGASRGRPTVTWDPELQHELWVTPPREDLVLRLRRVPYATLRVRVHDGVAGEDLQAFGVTVTAERMQLGGRGTNGVLELVLPRVPASGRTFTVKLLDPDEDEVQETVHVVEGETRDVVLRLYPDQVAGGVVTNAVGEPIEGVLVYFGDLTTIVGDDLLQGADPSRARGIRTDEQGWFRLTGGRPIVTFWHPAYQSLTLPPSDGMRVMLAERGAIVGSVGRGLDPASARLDGDGEPCVRSDGSFVFVEVDAGFHLVEFPGGERLSVILASNETVSLDRELRLPEVVLRLHASGTPLAEEFEGNLFGLQPVASCLFFRAYGGTARLGPVVPGEYLLWSYGGHASIVSLVSEELEVDVGLHELTVRAAQGGRCTLLPPAASGLPLRLHDLLSRGVAGGGELVFGPLRPGPYVLRDVGSGIELHVELDGSRVVDLP